MGETKDTCRPLRERYGTHPIVATRSSVGLPSREDRIGRSDTTRDRLDFNLRSGRGRSEHTCCGLHGLHHNRTDRKRAEGFADLGFDPVPDPREVVVQLDAFAGFEVSVLRSNTGFHDDVDGCRHALVFLRG